jgi:hypothetical protein
MGDQLLLYCLNQHLKPDPPSSQSRNILRLETLHRTYPFSMRDLYQHGRSPWPIEGLQYLSEEEERSKSIDGSDQNGLDHALTGG